MIQCISDSIRLLASRSCSLYSSISPRSTYYRPDRSLLLRQYLDLLRGLFRNVTFVTLPRFYLCWSLFWSTEKRYPKNLKGRAIFVYNPTLLGSRGSLRVNYRFDRIPWAIRVQDRMTSGFQIPRITRRRRLNTQKLITWVRLSDSNAWYLVSVSQTPQFLRDIGIGAVWYRWTARNFPVPDVGPLKINPVGAIFSTRFSLSKTPLAEPLTRVSFER